LSGGGNAPFPGFWISIEATELDDARQEVDWRAPDVPHIFGMIFNPPASESFRKIPDRRSIYIFLQRLHPAPAICLPSEMLDSGKLEGMSLLKPWRHAIVFARQSLH
jgi:hypothetical protein